MKTFCSLLVIIFFTNSVFSQVYTTDSKVEILEGHTWYPGKILEVKGDQYLIHYDRFNYNIWDIWIKKDRLRSAKLSQNNPGRIINKKPVSGIAKLFTASSVDGNVFYLMYPSGHVVFGCPKGGLEAFNYNTYCTNNSSNCGIYNKSGNSITITWNSGTTVKGMIMPNGEIEINGTRLGLASKVPNKLSASYSFTVNASGMSVAETIKFKDDGTYELERSSGYDNNDGKNSAEWQSAKKGRYTINGYTLTQTDNSGKVSTHTIFALESTKNPDYLGWDGNFLTKER